MRKYHSGLPPEKDRAFGIKQRMIKAEQRKSFYEQNRKGYDNDNFINHMQTLRRRSKIKESSIGKRYILFIN